MNGQFIQMPLFTWHTETEVSDGDVFIILWIEWWNGKVDVWEVFYITGG